MRRNPHPDLVREHLKRWRTRLIRACNEVVKLERALARAEARRAPARKAGKSKLLAAPYGKAKIAWEDIVEFAKGDEQ